MQITEKDFEGTVMDLSFDDVMKKFEMMFGNVDDKNGMREYVITTLKENGLIQSDLNNIQNTVRQLVDEYEELQEQEKHKNEQKYFTVGDMRNLIAGLDDSLPFIIQSDAEGNNYSPLSGVDMSSVYVPITTWYGNKYIKELTSKDIENGFSEEDLANPKDNPLDAVFLVPIN